MATLILTAAISALVTPTLGALAGAGAITAATATVVGSIATGLAVAAGGAIDQAYVYPSLFGDATKDASGPRITEVQTQHALEGTPIPWVMGPKNRLPGLLIWAGKLQEDEDKSGGGGGKSGGGSTTTYEYRMSIAIAVCEGPVKRIRRIWANGKFFYDDDNPGAGDSRYESITIHRGGVVQDPDAVIEGEEGVGNVPAFRGVTYFVVEDLELEDFGNAVPQFSVLVEKDEGPFTIADGYAAVLQRGDRPLDPSQFDVSRVTGNFTDIANELQGFVSNGPEPTDKVLEKLMLAYDNAVLERGGKLVFYDRGSEPIVPIIEEDLVATEGEGTSGPAPFTIQDIEATDLPAEVNVRYIDQQNRYQRATLTQRLIRPITDSVVDVDLPLTLESKQARIIAKRRLYGPWNERQRWSGSLPPSYVLLEPGDVLQVAHDGEIYGVRLERVLRGANLLHELEGVVQARSTDDGTGNLFVEQDADPQSPVPDDDDAPYAPPDVKTFLMDLPPLTADEMTEVGFYWAQAAASPNAPWKNATLWISKKPEPDAKWKKTKNQTKTEHTIGETLDVLPATLPNSEPIDPYVWDEASTLTVFLYDGFLSSVSREEVLDGDNWAVVGDEIIGFRNAALVADHIYTLSGLLRGLRATEDHMAGHDVGDRFVLLDELGVEFEKLKKKEWLKTRYLKNVPKGATIDDVPQQAFFVGGETSRPFPVCQVRRVDCEAHGIKDEEIPFRWTPRTRDILGMLDDVRKTIEPQVYDLTLVANGLELDIAGVEGTEFTITQAMQDQLLIFPYGGPILVRIIARAATTGRKSIATSWIV